MYYYYAQRYQSTNDNSHFITKILHEYVDRYNVVALPVTHSYHGYEAYIRLIIIYDAANAKRIHIVNLTMRVHNPYGLQSIGPV